MRTLVLLTRSPRAEAHAKGLPGKAGARLFRELLRSWLRAARRADLKLIVLAPAESVRELSRLCAPHGVAVAPQCDGDLGLRIGDAFARGFAQAGAPVLVAGGDSPAPAPATLAAAFAALEDGAGRLVLGPSPDGGVYAIGLAGPAPALLEGVPWRSAAVESTLRSRAHALGLDVAALPAVLDIDGGADVRRARALAVADPSWQPLAGALAALLASPPATPPSPPRLSPALLAVDLGARGPPASASLPI